MLYGASPKKPGMCHFADKKTEDFSLFYSYFQSLRKPLKPL